MSVQLSLPQSKAYVSQAKSLAVVAGFGAGKTDTALHKLFGTYFKYPGADMLYLAPTFPLIGDIWYPKVEEYLGESLGISSRKFKINTNRNIISVTGHGSVYCRTMEHPGRIVGFEALDAYIDEFDIIPMAKALEVWRKTKARCRQVVKGKTNQVCVVTTPEGFKATHKLFVKEPLAGSEIIQMSTWSNAHNLPEDYITELMTNYPAQLVDAYIEGKFVNLTQGTVYTEFDRFLNSSTEEAKVGEPLHIGMDFNVGKMSSVVHVYRNNLPVAVDELFKILDTPAMIVAIKERYPKNKSIFVYPDASGVSRSTHNASTSDLQLLKNAGFIVVANTSNPRIKDRLIDMNAMFCNVAGERRYKVNIAKCENYTDCLEQQPYGTDGLPDKQGDLDHLPDGAGYFINKRHGVSKPSSQAQKLKL